MPVKDDPRRRVITGEYEGVEGGRSLRSKKRGSEWVGWGREGPGVGSPGQDCATCTTEKGLWP
eukprot:1193-Hanusia_phi.AAC.1